MQKKNDKKKNKVLTHKKKTAARDPHSSFVFSFSLPANLYMDDFKIIRFVHSTLTCIVKHKRTKIKYIMKIRKELAPIPKFENEEKLLLALNSCIYLIQYHMSFMHDFKADWGIKQCIVYSYYPKGNLQEYIVNQKPTLQQQQQQQRSLIEEERHLFIWAYYLYKGLEALHAKNVIHQKLQSSNIFIDANDILKIGDIGLSKSQDAIITIFDNLESLATIYLDLLTGNMDISLSWEARISKIPTSFSSYWKPLIQNLMKPSKSEPRHIGYVGYYLEKIAIERKIVGLTFPTGLRAPGKQEEENYETKYDQPQSQMLNKTEDQIYPENTAAIVPSPPVTSTPMEVVTLEKSE